MEAVQVAKGVKLLKLGAGGGLYGNQTQTSEEEVLLSWS